MPYTGQNIFNSGLKSSRERSISRMQEMRSGNAFRVPEQINAGVKSSQKRFERSQQVRSGENFRIPDSLHARSASDQLRMNKMNAVRSGQYFQGNASQSYFERNMRSVQARAQRDAAINQG